MFSNMGVLSYSLAAITFGLLAILVAMRYLRRNTDKALVLAATVTSIWAASLVSQSLWGYPGFNLRYLIELVRDGAWIYLLFALLKGGFSENKLTGKVKQVLAVSAATLFAALLGIGLAEHFAEVNVATGKVKLLGQIGLTLVGLSLVEQIWRNSPSFGRSSIKYTCIGIATLFAFDFFMYADALLFNQIADSFWNARGFVNALLTPLFAVNVINTRKQPIDFQLSRSAVFHAGTLVFAGGYLLFLALGGYYVRIIGGDWGDALQILFFTISLVFLATLLLSRRIRSRLMVFISQNFFDYKYDYR